MTEEPVTADEIRSGETVTLRCMGCDAPMILRATDLGLLPLSTAEIKAVCNNCNVSDSIKEQT